MFPFLSKRNDELFYPLAKWVPYGKIIFIFAVRRLPMSFSTVFSSILVMGSMICIGSLLTRYVPFNEDTRKLLILIIVNVAMPCIILSSIFHFPLTETVLKQILQMFVLSIGMNLIGIAVGWGAARCYQAPPQKAVEMAILSGLGNTGFIGLPLCAALFGPKGALLAAVCDAGLDFTLWTAVVVMLQRNQKFSFRSLTALFNIPMMAVFVGLTLAFIGLKPPRIIVDITSVLAALAAPLAMIYIGMLVPTLWKKRISIPLPHLGIPIVCKLLLFPMIIAMGLHYISVDNEITQVVLVQSTMPTMTVASILFAKYAADEEMGAAATVFSTLLSLSTIPIMVYFCSHLI
jgi:malate permease and related proteins